MLVWDACVSGKAEERRLRLRHDAFENLEGFQKDGETLILLAVEDEA